MMLRDALKQQSLLKHLTYVLLLSLLLAGMLLAMTAMPIHVQRPYSPPSSWAKTYGETEREEAYWVQQTSDGGFIVGGTTQSFGVRGKDFWIIKLDSDGKIQWQRAYGGDRDDYFDTM